MEKVWKCDHCSETGKSWFKMAQHEKECEFNPINKHCWSCGNHSQDPYYMFGESYSCKVELSTDNGEENGNCKGWIKEKNETI